MDYTSTIKAIKRLDILQKIYLRKHMKPIPLHRGQFPIMEYIVNNPGCTQVEIASHLHVSPASIAGSAKRLSNSKLIKRSCDKNDLRRNQLYATKMGEQLALETRAVLNELHHRMFDGFAEDEMQQLTAAVMRMCNNIAEEHESDSMAELIQKLSKLEGCSK